VPALATAGLAALSVTQANAFTGGQVAAMSVAQTMALNASSTNYVSPLVLDLDGNGVRTLEHRRRRAVRHPRRRPRPCNTGWVDAHDGLLALDRNGDGVINDGGELFGSATTLADGGKAANGYAALQSLDSNGDGQITSRRRQPSARCGSGWTATPTASARRTS
jgi:hypothetical protein